MSNKLSVRQRIEQNEAREQASLDWQNEPEQVGARLRWLRDADAVAEWSAKQKRNKRATRPMPKFTPSTPAVRKIFQAEMDSRYNLELQRRAAVEKNEAIREAALKVKNNKAWLALGKLENLMAH